MSNYGSIRNDRDSVAEDADSEVEVDIRASQSSVTTSGQRSFGRIEFAAFLIELASGLHSVIRTNLFIEKVCRVDLNLGNKICDNIDNHQREQDMVQERVNDLNLYSIFLASVPWSVRHSLC